MEGYVWTCALVLMIFAGSISSEIIKVVSMYGKFTSKDDLYEQIAIDASSYVNDNNILAAGDRLNIIHNDLLGTSIYEERTLFQSVSQVCNNIRNTGAAGLIIPNDFCADSNCDQIGSILGEAYSPVLALDQADNSGAFKMLPILRDMDEMLTDVIAHFKWESFIFLYEGNVAFDLGEMLAAKAMIYGWRIHPIKIDAGNFEAQAEYLKSRPIRNVLVYVTHEHMLVEVVNTAFETKLLSNNWHWIFGNLNPPITQRFLEEKYRHNMAFLTRFKIDSNEISYFTSTPTPIKDWQFRQRAAYDAVVALAKALRLYKDERGQIPDPVESCSNDVKSELIPYLTRVNFRGASGDVSFNARGDRVNYTITMYSGKDRHAVNEAGLFVQDITSWERATGQQWQGKRNKRMYIKPFRQSDAKYIKILMVPEPPFFMEREEESRRYKVPISSIPGTEDDDYLGISWDLLKEIKKLFEEEMEQPFDYQIVEMSTGQYGTLDLSTGEWDGAMKEIIDGDADVIMGALQINAAREKDVDFTVPWYVSNAKLLLVHPSFTFEYPFVLVYPLSLASWFLLLTAFVFISILAWLIGRYDPYEWRGRSKRNMVSADDGRTYTLPDAILFVLSTGFWQGYIRGPRSWAFRILAAFWFFFAISITFLYLWNVNTVFKFSKTALNVEDQADLLMQDQFDFGVVRYSPSYDLYRYGDEIDREVFNRILNSHIDPIERSIEFAVERIRIQWGSSYTLVGEEKILEYAALRKPCRLYITGRTLGNITFGFATASGSPLRDQLTYAINVLRNRGVIEEIVNRQYSNNLNCPASKFKESARGSFILHDLQSVYYLMLIGMGGSLIVFFIEVLYYLLWKTDNPPRHFTRVRRQQLDDKEMDKAEEFLPGAKGGADWL